MRFLLLFSSLLTVALTSGCAHYQLGTTGKLSFHTLYIAPVENKAALPQSVAIISAQLREAFLRDGRVTMVNSPEEADATLSVSLSRLGREVTSARTDDTGLARKFNLDLTALCTLRDNRNSTLIFEKRPVLAEQQIFTTATTQQTDSQQLQAEYQALPQLAATLADKITHTTLDVW